MSVAENFNPEQKLNLDHDSGVCAICGHAQSDHPMNDVCWRDVVENGKVKLCSCPGFKAAAAQARSASE
jgi:hypothetical protein